MAKKTHEEFILEMKKINPNIEVISKYNGRREKVTCKCLLDEHEFRYYADYLLKGITCPKCNKEKPILRRKRKTQETFIKEMKEKLPHIEVLENYITAKTKIKFKCTIHNCEWTSTPDTTLKSCGCKECAIESIKFKQRKTNEQFIQEMKEINPLIEILEKYENEKTNLKCRCLIHNITWFATPDNLLHNKGCKKCAREKIAEKKTKTHDQFLKDLKLVNDDIEILSTYISATDKIKCRCKKDGYIWETTPYILLRGYGCKKCSMTRGERKIDNYLKHNNFEYDYQYKFNDCKNIFPLPFDFVVFHNKKIILIEYQGEQHYYPIDFDGKGEEVAKEKFEKQKINDNIKRKYCETNNITLIEIPYWIKNINIFLDNLLEDKNLKNVI